jgi:hypothetical protein
VRHLKPRKSLEIFTCRNISQESDTHRAASDTDVSANITTAILVSAEGVEIRAKGVSGIFRRKSFDRKLQFRWTEISRVCVFKRDCFTVDLICMVLELDDAESTEVNEEMPGWPALIEALPVYLPGALPQHEWWEKVMLPAFELCWTQLYSRFPQPAA